MLFEPAKFACTEKFVYINSFNESAHSLSNTNYSGTFSEIPFEYFKKTVFKIFLYPNKKKNSRFTDIFSYEVIKYRGVTLLNLKQKTITTAKVSYGAQKRWSFYCLRSIVRDLKTSPRRFLRKRSVYTGWIVISPGSALWSASVLAEIAWCETA